MKKLTKVGIEDGVNNIMKENYIETENIWVLELVSSSNNNVLIPIILRSISGYETNWHLEGSPEWMTWEYIYYDSDRIRLFTYYSSSHWYLQDVFVCIGMNPYMNITYKIYSCIEILSSDLPSLHGIDDVERNYEIIKIPVPRSDCGYNEAVNNFNNEFP